MPLKYKPNQFCYLDGFFFSFDPISLFLFRRLALVVASAIQYDFGLAIIVILCNYFF